MGTLLFVIGKSEYRANRVSFSIVALTILRLVYIFETNDSMDITFDYFNRALVTELITCLSLIVACISFIRPFLDSIETGVLASKIRNQNLGTAHKSPKHTKLEYAKNLFKPRANVSEERHSPLVASAQNPSGSAESYELSDRSVGVC